MGEVGAAHLPDREIELANRPRDQRGEQDRERDRDADGRKADIQPFLAALRRGFLQPFDRALRELAAGREHRLRAVDELRIAIGQLRRSSGWTTRSDQELVQAALAIGKLVERALRTRLERQRCKLSRRLPELVAQPRVFVEQRIVVENHVAVLVGQRYPPCRRIAADAEVKRQWRQQLVMPRSRAQQLDAHRPDVHHGLFSVGNLPPGER